MGIFLFIVFIVLAAAFFVIFLTGPYKHSPLWLMLSAWMMAMGAPRLHLSVLEMVWPFSFWMLVAVSLISFIAGFFLFKKIFEKYPFWQRISMLQRDAFSAKNLRLAIYVLFLMSLAALKMFYYRSGNFPVLAPDPDVFRFAADDKVPGLINYTAQLARIFIPLSFMLIFYERFSFKKHWDLLVIILAGTLSLLLFASRTQIYMIDLWVMALYLFIRKPNLKQAAKFYPFFLLVSVMVLAAIPLYRQSKSYQSGYLEGITQINDAGLPLGTKYLLPIYVGISFNMQALLHADHYYLTHTLQHGKVTLDPFTNLFKLHQYKSHYDLGEIFKSWWNTGTYLFPFVQDFGRVTFFIIPAIIAGFLTMCWRFFKDRPNNFLALSYYAYACFFITMTIYLSFTVRAEMYIDIFLLAAIYLIVGKRELSD